MISHSSTLYDMLGETFKLLSISCDTFMPSAQRYFCRTPRSLALQRAHELTPDVTPTLRLL